MEHLKDITYINNISYPGKFKKAGVIIDGKEYLLKISETEEERINLCSEMLGISLCNQLRLNTSHVKLKLHKDKLCLLSEKWYLQENEQYFPLASFYEELLDTIKQVPYSYLLLKDIVIKKAPSEYDDILQTFWGLFIVDYLICNSRAAGNIGFLHNGNIRLSPIFDCSTSLESPSDNRFKDLSFPRLRMTFDMEPQSAHNVLSQFKDDHKALMMEKAKNLIKLDALSNQITLAEEEYMFKVISYRYLNLFT